MTDFWEQNLFYYTERFNRYPTSIFICFIIVTVKQI